MQAYAYDEAAMLRGIQAYRAEQPRQPRPSRRDIAQMPTPPPPPGTHTRPWRKWMDRQPVCSIDSLPLPAKRFCIAICDHYGLRVDELTALRGGWRSTRPRQVLMYLMVIEAAFGAAATGRALGGLHHTTVLHAVNVVRARMAKDEHYRAMVEGFAGRKISHEAIDRTSLQSDR